MFLLGNLLGMEKFCNILRFKITRAECLYKTLLRIAAFECFQIRLRYIFCSYDNFVTKAFTDSVLHNSLSVRPTGD